MLPDLTSAMMPWCCRSLPRLRLFQSRRDVLRFTNCKQSCNLEIGSNFGMLAQRTRGNWKSVVILVCWPNVPGARSRLHSAPESWDNRLDHPYSTSPRNGNRHFSGKQESSHFFLCYPGRQAREFPFSTRELGQNFKAQTRPPGAEPEPWMMIR